MTDGQKPALAALTAEARARVEAVAADPALRHAVFTSDAEEIVADPALPEDAVPVAANLVDIADRFASDLGDEAGCQGLILESRAAELAVEPLGEPWLLTLRRKGGGHVG